MKGDDSDASRKTRGVLFLQCTNAGHYPPILNASMLMADAGWLATVLSSPGGDQTRLTASEHPGVSHLATATRKENRVRPVDYLVYCAAAVRLALRLEPRVIYASDPLSALPALMAAKATGASLVYHEHDYPGPGRLRFLVGGWRAAAMRRAHLVIAPNQERGRLMLGEIGFNADRLRTVWNMPRRVELPEPSPPIGGPLILYYHGSISPDRLPETVIDALRRLDGRVRLRIAGYEAPGALGYVDRLVRLGQRSGVAPLVEYAGLAPRRSELLAAAARAHVGLALMPIHSGDVNMRHMTGASNKAFDYMAAGLALLVSDLSDWREMFATPGYGRSCDPTDPASIAAELSWFRDHDAERRAMATCAREKIKTDWNYDTAFAPVLESLSHV